MRLKISAIPFLLMLAAVTLVLAGCARQETSQPTKEAPVGQTSAESTAAEAAPADALSAGELAQREKELAAREAELRERELATREAALSEREARLQAERRQAKESRPAAAEPATRPAESTETSVPAPAPAPETERAAEPLPEPEPVRRIVPVTVPGGTVLDVEFLDALSSETSAVGQRFSARVTNDVLVDGQVAIPAGSRVVGSVAEAVPGKKIGGQSRLALHFDRLELAGGESVSIDAAFTEVGKSQTGKDAATIGGATAGGAILGRVINKNSKSKGTLVGAIVGAAVGTAIASNTPGEPVEIPAGAVISLTLNDWIRVHVER